MSNIGKKIYTNVYSNFIDFLKRRKLLTVVVTVFISINVSHIVNLFIESFVSPLINKLLGGNTINLEDRTYTIYNITFPLGRFFNGLIQFILIIYIFYVVYSIYTNT